jgi:hypothetical protein
MNTLNINSKQSFLCFFIACVLLCAWVSAIQGQTVTQSERLITESKFKAQPIEIVGVRVNENRVELDRSFTNPDKDWLRHLSFDVRNISNKTITYVQMRLLFERPGSNGLPCVFPLIRGIDSVFRRLDSALTGKTSPPDPNDAVRAILVRPGDSVSLSFSDKTYDGLQRFLKDVNWEGEVYSVKLYLSRVIFDDGTIWMKGTEVKPDPLNPSKFLPVLQKDSTSKIEQNGEYRLLPVNYLPASFATRRKTRVRETKSFDSGCTRAVETYFYQCGINVFHQCYKETFWPYSPGDYRWQGMDIIVRPLRQPEKSPVSVYM